MKRKGASKSDGVSTPMFIRVKPETRKWLDDEAYRTGHFIGHILDTVIAAVKNHKKYKLEEREMKTLAKVKSQHENRLNRYKSSNKK